MTREEIDDSKSTGQACNVRDFEAVGDGEADDTRAIEKAIDAAAEICGEVYFPAGAYMAAAAKVRPQVTLRGCFCRQDVVH